MKKTLRKIILLFSILVSMTNILFLSSTILSSERFYSDVIPDLLCIRRGYPFVFISINNSGNCFDTKKLLLNVLCSVCVSICIIILLTSIYYMIKSVSFRKKSVCYVFSLLAVFGGDKSAFAATASVSSWRIINNGKMSYNCLKKYQKYATVAQNKWNDHISNVITESNSPDLIIRDSSNLGTAIGGVTYSNGVIYFNNVVWPFFNEDEKKNCAIHEMGHALGLAHNDGSKKNVMYSAVTTTIELSANDKASYNTSYALSFFC